MPGKVITVPVFALRTLMKKYREGQRELHCIFVDQEKAYDRVPREELWFCMRKSGMVEKNVRLVQDMYEGSETMVRCAVGTTESFEGKVGLHQRWVLSPFLFAVIMDSLTDEVRREPPLTMLFADDMHMLFADSVQNPLAPFCCVLGKDPLRHYPLLGGLGKQL